MALEASMPFSMLLGIREMMRSLGSMSAKDVGNTLSRLNQGEKPVLS